MCPGADRTTSCARPTSPVCPIRTFADEPIYLHEEPDAGEVAERIDRYWRPYHDCLARELEHLRDAYGYALLWDGHSVASEVHGLFTGVLPEFNLGTRDGASCPRAISDPLLDIVLSDGEFGAVAVVSGHIRGETNTLPLHIEALYNGFNAAAAFAVASLLAMLALVTLVAKSLLEWKTQRDLKEASESAQAP